VALAEALPPEGHNALVDALGSEARRLLEQRGSEIELKVQQPLAAEEEGVDGVYFPLSGLMCRLVSLPEGASVKVSVVGREGLAGSSAMFGPSVSAFRTVVQIPGTALFLPRGDATRLLAAPGVASVMSRYLHLLVRETSLTAACNRAHRTQQRLARWLLLIADRADLDEFPLTHDSLASILGVRRESITLAASALRGAGAIAYQRGRVAITSRTALLQESCSCYREVTETYVRFLASKLTESALTGR
jgi:CRP-like cAMP-binding protein